MPAAKTSLVKSVVTIDFEIKTADHKDVENLHIGPIQGIKLYSVISLFF
jgi:hypothetical protein